MTTILKFSIETFSLESAKKNAEIIGHLFFGQDKLIDYIVSSANVGGDIIQGDEFVVRCTFVVYFEMWEAEEA